MGNERETQYDFCPQCGALTRDGICTGCGYGKPVEEAKPVEEVQPVEEVNPEEVQPVEEVQQEEAVKAQETVEQADSVQGGYYGSPYSEYSNRISFSNGAIPPDVPEKKNNKKTVAIVCICIGVFLILLCLLGYCVFSIVKRVNEQGGRKAAEYYDEEFWDDQFDEASKLPKPDSNDEEEYDYREFYKDITGKNEEDSSDREGKADEHPSEGRKTYGHSPEDDYYEDLESCIRQDLPYSVEFKSEVYEEEHKDVHIGCTYPVLSGDIPNCEYLNQTIYEEYRYFVDFYKEKVREDMTEDEYFSCALLGYVTYMDEEHLSIVFSEDANWNDDYFLVSLYCINIDVEQGVVQNNTELLEINDDFSVEFRIREGEQNVSNTLDVYTDQELTEMLSDSVDLIVFYTPLGMEVGVNHDVGWATATYKDYEKYLKHF